MKIISYLSALLILGSAPIALHAQETVPPTSSNVEKIPKNVPFRGTISEVNATGGTFTIANKDKSKVRVFTIAKSAKLTRDEKDITLADVKVGEYARGSGIKTGPDKFEVVTGKFGAKSADEIAADKAKKDKKKADTAE